jgi:AmmeMemoRadiSam system protein A
MLTDAQKHALLDLARRVVSSHVSGLPAPGTLDVDLRGCLGTLECTRGLAAEVSRCAADAASEDPRFPPVANDELPEIALEISVLGPLEPIDPRRDDAIAIGRHGLVAEQGHRRGLLLPQVATEWGWTREQFLRQTCVKAGLGPDAWEHGARISRFDAEVFGD